MSKKRIVVKIGSSSLTNNKGQIDHEKLADHVAALAALRKAGHEVILVSSGAIAAGFSGLGYLTRPVTIKGKQAAAAVGQSLLIQSYMERFAYYHLTPAQILLTRSDFSSRERYRNAFATMEELLERGMVPIINENDSVSAEELTFGDNDMLSALVSGFVHADQLMILTDINGLYDANPNTNFQAKRVDVLDTITEGMLANTGEAGSNVGTGGMRSKLLAAKTATSLGVPVFIGRGAGKNKLLEVLDGNGDGTYVTSHSARTINTRKQWIALHSEAAGNIYVDRGAEEAILFHGKSLLPAGVFKLSGSFQKGNVVEVYGSRGLLGKGEVNCSSGELKQVIEGKTSIVPFVEVIHRDGWVKTPKIGEGIL